MKIVENIKCPENDHFLNTKISKNIGLRRWKGYNKLDTKLREIVERFIMARRKFDKQFKNSAVKLILEEGY
ncbi:hypothetical protein, partial [Lactococcus cremoris]|uniref:hypothetical protein n=1 Tax=Lactococcus lactis subsp. cremoris TaxID=1359 RepID=UPI00300DE149